MTETAAHRVDHVFPPLPVRQWVLSVPKRLRYFLQREPAAVDAVLHSFLRILEQTLRTHSGAGPQARLGAVSFLHRCGSALNPHLHLHCCVLDGVFEAAPDAGAEVRFREAVGLSAQAVAAVQAQARRRVLRGFVRRAWLSEEDWSTGQLVEYSLLNQSPTQPINHLPKPGPDGRTQLTLTPLELIDRLAALIPPPHLHRHRYHGVLAPNAPLRAAVTALAREPPATTSRPAVAESVAGEGHYRSPARYLWAMLIARIYQVFPLVCPHCGAEIRIIAFITETASVTRSLRFAIRLRWAVQGTPSLACPLDGAKVHRTFAFRPSRPRAHRRAHHSARALTRARSARL